MVAIAKKHRFAPRCSPSGGMFIALKSNLSQVVGSHWKKLVPSTSRKIGSSSFASGFARRRGKPCGARAADFVGGAAAGSTPFTPKTGEGAFETGPETGPVASASDELLSSPEFAEAMTASDAGAVLEEGSEYGCHSISHPDKIEISIRSNALKSSSSVLVLGAVSNFANWHTIQDTSPCDVLWTATRPACHPTLVQIFVFAFPLQYEAWNRNGCWFLLVHGQNTIFRLQGCNAIGIDFEVGYERVFHIARAAVPENLESYPCWDLRESMHCMVVQENQISNTNRTFLFCARTAPAQDIDGN